MARVAGVEIPDNKQVLFSLPYVYGIGRSRAKQIAEQTNIPLDKMVGDLTEEELVRLRAVDRE